MGAPGFSGGYVQDPWVLLGTLTVGRPIGDLHPLLWGTEGSLQAFMATIFGLHGPYGQGISRFPPAQS
jgi:hypothetical protein